MRNLYYGKLSLIAAMLLVVPLCSSAANKKQEQMVTEGVSMNDLVQNLRTHQTEYLKRMMVDSEMRLDYVKEVYSDQKLEQLIIEKNLGQSQLLLAALYKARKDILFNTWLEYEFDQINEDLTALALERYEANPDTYRQHKRIKVAVIFIKKRTGKEDEARAKTEGILTQLKDNPEDPLLFFKLAEEHSDDPLAHQGGVNKKWLIAPSNLKESTPALQAAFELETPGQLTEVIESDAGFTIVGLLGAVEGRQLSFGEVKPEIIAKIKQNLMLRKKAEVFESLKADDNLVIDDETIKNMISTIYSSRTSENSGD